MPKPSLKVTVEDKLRILATIIPPCMTQLAAMSPDKELSADDVIDLFAMGAALLIDNDSNVRTARDFRLGSETVATMTQMRAREFREAQNAQGHSLFSAMIGQVGDQTRN